MSDKAEAERKAIIAWLDECRAIHEENAKQKGYAVASKHHANACKWIAAGIADMEHHAVRING